MYKTFAKERVEALRRGDKEATEGSFVARAHEDKSRGRYREQERERYFGMHAARCFLAALSGYQGSGWRAAEDYTCNALPTEVRYVDAGSFCFVLFLFFVFCFSRRELKMFRLSFLFVVSCAFCVHFFVLFRAYVSVVEGISFDGGGVGKKKSRSPQHHYYHISQESETL